MEPGPILAILAGAIFAGSEVTIRKATHRAEESFTAVAIVLFAGVVIFAFILPLSGDWNRVLSLSWQGFLLLGAVGIIHYVIGRYLFFNSIRYIGANIAGAVTRTSLIFAVIFGVVFLQESVTVWLISGALAIMVGVVLVSFHKEEKIIRLQARGIIFSLGHALCLATSAVLIKVVMEEIVSPYAAAFVSYIVGFFLVVIILLGKRRKLQLFQLSRSYLILVAFAGVLALVAQVMRYAALSLSPVSVVTPLMGTLVLFTFILSFVINRKIEVFTWRVFVGILVVLGGTALLFI